MQNCFFFFFSSSSFVFLDNFLLKNVIIFFFGNQIWKWRSFEKKKRLFLTYFSHFLFTREKTQKFLQHISHLHTYIHVFCSPYWLFCLTNFCKNRTVHGDGLAFFLPEWGSERPLPPIAHSLPSFSPFYQLNYCLIFSFRNPVDKDRWITLSDLVSFVFWCGWIIVIHLIG